MSVRHSCIVSPLLLLRGLLLLPSLLFVLRPSSERSSSSPSSSSATTNEFRSSSVLLANALPISMLNSMTRFYPMNSLQMETQPTNKKKEEKFKQKTQDETPNIFGRLKLCPPGGRSFFEAFELACPMKKRRRKRHAMFGFGRAHAVAFGRGATMAQGGADEKAQGIAGGDVNAIRQRRKMYRPANTTELMQICCTRGCEFADLLPHCGPFSMW
ncbi:hypothetical protein niasHT_036780 [Heterodera trifolii]|uniref:Insulin-like domain-containing protein n=1 Tax=Heterodera trifolii TaxID=157864 RepID=A0ABD2IXF1_9BILA